LEDTVDGSQQRPRRDLMLEYLPENHALEGTVLEWQCAPFGDLETNPATYRLGLQSEALASRLNRFGFTIDSNHLSALASEQNGGHTLAATQIKDPVARHLPTRPVDPSASASPERLGTNLSVVEIPDAVVVHAPPRFGSSDDTQPIS
jgi:hypothetical protein